MQFRIFVLVSFLGSVLGIPPSVSKIYRLDYEYNSKTNAFYKVHLEEEEYNRAVDICDMEGALVNTGEAFSLLQGLQGINQLGKQWWISDTDSGKEREKNITITYSRNKDYRTNWQPTQLHYTDVSDCYLIDRSGSSSLDLCVKNYPFICKVDAAEAKYDEQCGVYSRGYNYSESLHSCYKVPNVAYTWNQAHIECQMQGATLVILNSEEEHLFIKKLLETAPRIKDGSADENHYYYAGIRAKRPSDTKVRVFRTIHGEPLFHAGYNEWTEGEPNNHKQLEYCGSIFLDDGKYNDVNCDESFAFICEKTVPHRWW